MRMELPYKVDIWTMVGGELDEDGNEVPPQKQFICQGKEADFQPLSGQRRAASSGTAYESTHKLFLFPPLPGEIPEGAKVKVQGKPGELEVIFVADWEGEHWEVELRLVK